MIGTDLHVGTVQVTEHLHFTGGLRGIQTELGWHVVPIQLSGAERALGPLEDTAI